LTTVLVGFKESCHLLSAIDDLHRLPAAAFDGGGHFF
jgi:hypothetical protein